MIRVSIAKALVVVAENATEVADKLLRREAQVAYDKLDSKLTAAQEAAAAARQRAQAAEMRAAIDHTLKLGKLNEKLEDYSYAIPSSKVR